MRQNRFVALTLLGITSAVVCTYLSPSSIYQAFSTFNANSNHSITDISANAASIPSNSTGNYCDSGYVISQGTITGFDGKTYVNAFDFTHGTEKINSSACGREYLIQNNPSQPNYNVKFVYLVNGSKNRVSQTIYTEQPDGSLQVYQDATVKTRRRANRKNTDNAGAITSLNDGSGVNNSSNTTTSQAPSLANTIIQSTSLANTPTIASVNPNTLSIQANGKPVFPFGFYHVSPYGNQQTKRLTDLRTIASAGFNIMAVPIGLNNGAFLDEAGKSGVYIIGEFNDDPMSVIKAFKNKPAILGWNVADDVDDGKKTVAEVTKFSNQVKAADPQHLTYESGYTTNRIANFVRSADLVAMQTYPIPAEELNSTNYSLTAAIKATTPALRPLIANLQAFAWQGSRAPRPTELRNMTYQALVDGVKGIIYYTYYDSTWDMTKNPAVWNELKSLTPEIKQLTPFLLNGKRTKITTADYTVFAGLWTYQNQSIAVVINTSSTATKTVNISLPVSSLRGVTPMFANRPAGIVVNNGKLSGSIKAEGVHVYRLQP